jgi:hypothetical protein
MTLAVLEIKLFQRWMNEYEYGELWNNAEKTETVGNKPVLVPLSPPEINSYQCHCAHQK